MPEVSDADIHEISEALEMAFYHSQCQDLLESYRRLASRTPSPLTKALETALKKAQSYKENADER